MDATLSRFLRWIDARQGVCHTSDARADGIPPGAIAAAIEQGLVARVRRSWLVTAGCDPRRRAAASVSGRVTCVTAAGLYGLWVPHDTAAELHIAVSHNAARLPRDGMHLHWGQGPAPVGRNTVDDHILNVLFQTAGCLGRREALPIWQSAAARGHVEPAELVRVAWRSREARALAAATSTLSDSGIETVFVTGMDAEGVTVRQQVWVDGHPLDGLIGDRLGIQLDGLAHHRAAQRRRDLRADARLALRGFTLLRFDYQQVMFDWDHVRSTVLMAMAQGLHRAR